VLFCVALTSGLGPRPACLQANDLNYSLYEQRLADLESEVEFLRDLQKQKHAAPYQTCDDWYSCQPAHLDFGAELAFLAPNSTTGLGPSGIAFFPSTETFPSWRLWLGYTGPKGLGVRARYWEFDHLATNDLNAFTYGLDAYTADLELTYSKLIGNDWDVLVSGGVRHFGFREERAALATSFVKSDLTGLVVGAEVNRALIGNLRGYGLARAATVFGNLSGEVPPGFVVYLESRHAFMWESQLGLEYCRETRCGELSLRLGAEVMHWDSVSYKEISVTHSAAESVGLVGLVTGITIRR
jgi:hypothetical protein